MVWRDGGIGDTVVDAVVDRPAVVLQAGAAAAAPASYRIEHKQNGPNGNEKRN